MRSYLQLLQEDTRRFVSQEPGGDTRRHQETSGVSVCYWDVQCGFESSPQWFDGSPLVFLSCALCWLVLGVLLASLQNQSDCVVVEL